MIWSCDFVEFSITWSVMKFRHVDLELTRGGKQSTFGTNPHLLSYFEVKEDKIHFWGKKSTLALFSAILGVKVDFSFWHLNPLIHYFEKILGSKWKKSTFGTFKIFEKFWGQFSGVHLFRVRWPESGFYLTGSTFDQPQNSPRKWKKSTLGN